jgi:hypothetical protein
MGGFCILPKVARKLSSGQQFVLIGTIEAIDTKGNSAPKPLSELARKNLAANRLLTKSLYFF